VRNFVPRGKLARGFFRAKTSHRQFFFRGCTPAAPTSSTHAGGCADAARDDGRSHVSAVENSQVEWLAHDASTRCAHFAAPRVLTKKINQLI